MLGIARAHAPRGGARDARTRAGQAELPLAVRRAIQGFAEGNVRGRGRGLQSAGEASASRQTACSSRKRRRRRQPSGNTTIDDTVRLFLRLLQERGQLRGAEEGVRAQLMAVLGTSSSSSSTSAPAAQQQQRLRSSTPLIATPLAWGKQILASPARLASRLFENDESPRVASPLASPSIALATPQATPAAAAQPFVRSYSPAPDLNLELADDDESEEDLPDWLLEASMRVAREEEETTAAATYAGLPGRMPTPPPPPSPPAKSPSSSILEPLESGLLWLTQATQSVTEQVLFFSTFGLIGGHEQQGGGGIRATAAADFMRPSRCGCVRCVQLTICPRVLSVALCHTWLSKNALRKV